MWSGGGGGILLFSTDLNEFMNDTKAPLETSLYVTLLVAGGGKKEN